MPPKGISNTKAFKPPSRAASASTTNAGVSKTSKSKASAATSRRTSAADTALMDTFDDDEDNDTLASSLGDPLATPKKAQPAQSSKAKPSSTVSPAQSIPADLLRTLLQHHFQDKSMKVSGEASLLVGKYMDTFVREAIARAAFERTRTEGTRNKGGDFLEVDDLEKLAPQLLLDF